MTRFIARRALQGLVTLLGVSVLLFVLFRLTPGDPVAILVNLELPREAQLELRQRWGLDEPLWIQFVNYLRNVLQGHWGISFFYNQPVWRVIWTPVANTLMVMAPAALFAIGISVASGAVVGWRRGSRLEQTVVLLPLIVRSVPPFIGAIGLVWVFSYWLRVLPSGGMGSAGLADSSGGHLWDLARHAALPMVTAVIYFLPEPFMIMRTTIAAVKRETFVFLLHAKGVPERQVMRHCVKNSMLPVLSWISILGTYAFGAQVIIETVFSWPGIGREMVLAAMRLDYPLAQAAFFLMSAVVITLNLLTDVMYVLIDPRGRG